MSFLRLLAVGALVAGCAHSPTADSAPASFQVVTTGVWELQDLEGARAALGAGGRRATLQFGPEAGRVAGFAGCNQYFSTYTVDGAALRFSTVGMTRMACADGMTLEQRLARALEATRRYRVAAGELTLLGEAGPVARFVRVTPD